MPLPPLAAPPLRVGGEGGTCSGRYPSLDPPPPPTRPRMPAEPAPTFSQPWDPLRAYRIVLALGAVFVPGFGVLYGALRPDAVDPAGWRAAISVLALALVVGSYASGAVRERMGDLYRLLAGAVGVWFVWLVARNSHDASYTFGLIFTTTALTAVFGVGLRRLWPLVAFGAALTVAATYAGAGGPYVPAALVVTMVGSNVCVIALVLRFTLRMQRELEDGRARLEAVLREAADGILLLDDAFCVREANAAAARFFGQSEAALRGRSLADLAPESAVPVRALRETVHAHGHGALRDLRPARPDGAPVFLDAHANRMAEARTATGRRRPTLITVSLRDAAERRRYEAELVAARHHAEEMEAFKTSMLANVGHEVRTPVSIILGSAAILREEMGEAGEHAELLGYIEGAGQRLARMLGVLIEVAELDAGTRALRREPTDVAALLGEVAENAAERADAQGLRFSVDVPGGPVLAVLDALCLRRVADHLIENALKFTHAGGIRLQLTATEAALRLRVEDTGIGLPEAFRAHVFAPFRQASTGPARTYEGFGLGLHLTRRLVGAMGGEIGFTSGPGGGTAFTVDLPRRLDAVVVEAAPFALAA